MITKEMNIIEVINRFPETLRVFQKFGFHCIGCAAARYENIGQAAEVHGANVDELIDKLNKCVLNNNCGTEEKGEI